MSVNSENKIFPFQINDLGPEENAYRHKYFGENVQDGFVRVGPKGYFFSNGFRDIAEKIYNMPVRPDDTWVITYPRSGTTLVQEMVWLLANDFDFKKAKEIGLGVRFQFLEVSMFMTSDKCKQKFKEKCGDNEKLKKIVADITVPGADVLASTPSPRFIKTHMPLSLLPPRTLDVCKMVHVARDPRDIAVSYYYQSKLFNTVGYTGGFKEFWDYFINDMLYWTPYFENIKESWEQRNHPNMLFLFYEDILEDLPSAVRRVAQFLGRSVTEKQLALVCDHLDIRNFKHNKAVNYDYATKIGLVKGEGFIRKGKAGGWRAYFDEEMAAQAQRWIDDNLRGTDLRFPSVHKQKNN